MQARDGDGAVGQLLDRQDRNGQAARGAEVAEDADALAARGRGIPEIAPVLAESRRAVPRAGRSLTGKAVGTDLDGALENPIQPATAISECSRDHELSSTTQSATGP